MSLVHANGVDLAYEEAGSGDPPFLFIHGLAGNRTLFPAQVEHYARSHRVVVYDQRGHGDSQCPPDGPFDLPTLAEDARGLAEELGLKRPVVVGHSLGGTVAIALASRYPDTVRALVVLDSVFKLEAGGAAGLAAFYASMTDDTYASTVADFVRHQLAAPSDDPEVIEAGVAMMTSLPRQVFVALGQGRLAFDGVAAAKRVTAPTLFIGAARPFADLVSVRHECPRWYVGKVVGSGHKLQLLVPDQVNAMIDRFLAQVEAGFPDELPEASF